MKKNILKGLLALLALVLVYLAVVLVHGTLNDWQPPAETPLELAQVATAAAPDSVLSLAIWNVGYGGLGDRSNFFYDQGKFLFAGSGMVRASQDLVNEYNAGIFQFASSTQADVFLLQEVDWSSRRSYHTPQFDSLRGRLPTYAAAFAANYQVRRVPIPVFEPWRAYGRVHSGLATLSRWQPQESTRLQLPGSFGWPNRIFQLDRCLLLSRFTTAAGKELVVINLHNSAYDSDGSLKRAEMAFLRELILAEYQQGHYVIVGGDWNQTPPFFRFDALAKANPRGITQSNIDPDFLPPSWQWIYDPTQPTNRKLYEVYQPDQTFVTIIDFFLVSPNVRVRKVKAINQDFRYSDHQPVWMEVELLGE